MTPSEFTKRWKATPNGRASTKRYEQSEKGRVTRRRANAAWKSRNLPRVREHNRVLQNVRYAVQTGKIAKAPCMVCGADRVHAHHPRGYDREHMFDVEWLCPRHHTDAHHRTAEAAA
jgi:hypothetical protein